MNTPNNGIKVNEYGFTLVNTNRFISSNGPYVLASQVRQEFYVEDPLEKDWHAIIKTVSRDLYNVPENDLEAHNDVLYIQN